MFIKTVASTHRHYAACNVFEQHTALLLGTNAQRPDECLASVHAWVNITCATKPVHTLHMLTNVLVTEGRDRCPTSTLAVMVRSR